MASIGDSLIRLSQWATDPVPGKSSRASVRHCDARISALFSKKVSRFSGLKTVMSELVTAVREERDPDKKKAKLQHIQSILGKIRREYLSLGGQGRSLSVMRQKYDLLEAFTIGLKDESLQKMFAQHSIQPLARIRSEKVLAEIEKVRKGVKKPLAAVQGFAEKEILLVEYQNMKRAVAALSEERDASGQPLTGPELADRLKDVLKVEDVPFGKGIDFLYSHRFVGREDLNRVMTAFCKWKYNSPEKVADVDKILSFFQKMHITPETEFRGEIYSFSEVFGYDLEAPKTYAESFGRVLFQTSELMKKLGVKREGVEAETCFREFKERVLALEHPESSVERLWKRLFTSIGEASTIQEAIEKLPNPDDRVQLEKLNHLLQAH